MDAKMKISLVKKNKPFLSKFPKWVNFMPDARISDRPVKPNDAS